MLYVRNLLDAMSARRTVWANPNLRVRQPDSPILGFYSPKAPTGLLDEHKTDQFLDGPKNCV